MSFWKGAKGRHMRNVTRKRLAKKDYGSRHARRRAKRSMGSAM